MVAYAGFFDDAGKAHQVRETLRGRNYSEKEVLLIEPAAGDDLKKTLSSAKNRDILTSTQADRARAGVEQGKTFLLVKARLGDGTMVQSLFADGGEEVRPYTASIGHVFFSDIIGLPILAETYRRSSGPPTANKPLTGYIIPCVISRRGARSASMGLPLLGKPLVTGFIPLTMKPLVTSIFPQLWNKRSK